MNGIKVVGLLLTAFLMLEQGYFNEARAAESEGADTYIGLQIGTADTSVDDLSGDFDLDYGLLQLGIWANEEVSIEFRTGVGTSKESSGGIDYEIESLYGLYGLYHYHLGEIASLYGALGVSRVTLKSSIPGDSVQENENGLSYGVGAKLSVFTLEYMRYLNTTDVTVDAISLGIQYTFD
jgi:outer membrane immunogenic protein